MGGELLFGMRDAQGREKLQLRWTNPVPFIAGHPTFLTEGKLWKKLWTEKTAKKGWPGAVNVKKVQPSEYGVVLVDAKNKVLFSRQDYCTPNMLHLQGLIDPEMCEVVLSKKGACKLTIMNKREKGPLYVKPSKVLEEKFWELMLQGFGTNAYVELPAYFQLTWKPPKGWTFDFGEKGKNHRARYCWKEVMQFLKKQKWKSRVAK